MLRTHDRRALDDQVNGPACVCVFSFLSVLVPGVVRYSHKKGYCEIALFVRVRLALACTWYLASSTGRSSMLVIRDRYMLPVRTDPKVFTEN